MAKSIVWCYYNKNIFCNHCTIPLCLFPQDVLPCNAAIAPSVYQMILRRTGKYWKQGLQKICCHCCCCLLTWYSSFRCSRIFIGYTFYTQHLEVADIAIKYLTSCLRILMKYLLRHMIYLSFICHVWDSGRAVQILLWNTIILTITFWDPTFRHYKE